MNSNEVARSFMGIQQNLSITKEMLKKLKLIGQIDSKFVACTLTDNEQKFLILLDQHAVDERLRLEQLQRKYRRDLMDVRRSKLVQPLKFKIHFEDGDVGGYSDGFSGIERVLEASGIVCRIKTSHGRVVCKIFESPTDLLRKIIRRKSQEEYFAYLKDSVRKLIQNAVKSKSPCGDFFGLVMASEACARAVKFGERLEQLSMVNMLEKLSHCNMPFQCAHGRPTLTVINYEPLERIPKRSPNLMKFVSSEKNGGGSPTSLESGDEYDPHIHRQLEHATTNMETLIHLLKGSLGTGILAMPQAFFNAGLFVGAVCTIIIGIICTYCLHVLVRSQYILCKRLKVPVLTYPESMKIALQQGPECLRRFAAISAPIVDVFMISYQLGICCVYIVFVATNVKQVADIYWTVLDVRIWSLILLLPLIAINMIRNLKLLAPFSQGANIITFIGISIVMYYVFRDIPPMSTREYAGELRNFSLFFGTTLFALEAVGVIIALENNMQTPKSFGGYTGVLNKGMTVIVLLYVFVGFFGYIKYGPACLGSITLNLPSEEILAQSVNVIFAIAIFITYALQCYVPVEIIWTTYMKKKYEHSEHKLLYEYIMRICVVIVTFLLAVAIPRLGLFISLFGALCLSALGIAFPAIIEICVLWPDNLGKFKYVLWRDLLLILFGIVGLVVGTGTALMDIIVSFQ